MSPIDKKLKIETLLAGSLSTAKKVSNLLLAQGQVYVMHKKYDSLEIFQVITPSSDAGQDVVKHKGHADHALRCAAVLTPEPSAGGYLPPQFRCEARHA